MELNVKIVARSPICLSSSYTGFTSQTIEYISGSALRGALAGAYLRAGRSAEDPLFRELFMSEQVSFPNLYPGASGSAPIPMSARSCKRFPGSGDDASEHGVFDRLMEMTASEKQDVTNSLRCPRCSSPLDRINGFYHRTGKVARNIKVKKRLMTHVGISRLTGTAEEGFLYSLEVLEEGQEFSGQIICADHLADKLQGLLEQFRGELFVGTARTRGLGRLSIADISPSKPVAPDLKTFDQRYRANVNDTAPKGVYFTLTLLSDAILQDDFFRYQGVIGVDHLVAYGLKSEAIEPQEYLAQQIRIQGWNSAAGWPKEDNIGIRKGSVFLYHYSGETAVLQNAMLKIQQTGIGGRRAEGFGRVSVNDPFHWEVGR